MAQDMPTRAPWEETQTPNDAEYAMGATTKNTSDGDLTLELESVVPDKDASAMLEETQVPGDADDDMEATTKNTSDEDPTTELARLVPDKDGTKLDLVCTRWLQLSKWHDLLSLVEPLPPGWI
jgi:hypothetical protein